VASFQIVNLYEVKVCNVHYVYHKRSMSCWLFHLIVSKVSVAGEFFQRISHFIDEHYLFICQSFISSIFFH